MKFSTQHLTSEARTASSTFVCKSFKSLVNASQIVVMLFFFGF